ncbi:MAG: RNA-directed DNA polymerase [Alistipes sp.]|uniref:reverse transcriptase family protein n=1 Tax=Alistipes TaxID=239759 RepID=UPI00101C2384|nr:MULTISPECIES: reverse transcriptase family protein [Alistipes]MBR2219193.1 RNA-directed DNA polymerase [Alistipes sp.]
MISNPKSLCRAIGIKYGEIATILADINAYYYEYEKKKRDKKGELKYTKFGTPEVRVINPSIRALKIVQKKICGLLNSKITPAPYAFGSTKGRSCVMNARFHQGNKYIFQTDLRGFFPSITREEVYRMFMLFGFSPDVASILTRLTTYKGHIPQGAPTSSLVANLVFTKTGDILADYCKQHGLKFSTYVDDMTISGPSDFQELIPEILDIIRQDGYTISHTKTTYRTNHPEITGAKVGNNYIDITDKLKAKIANPQGKSEAQIAGEQNYRDLVYRANNATLKSNKSPILY